MSDTPMPDLGRAVLLYPHPGDVGWHFMRSLRQLEAFDRANGINVFSHDIAIRSGANITSKRNLLIAAFLETDAEWAWFCDTDMVFEKDTLIRLLVAAQMSEAKIIGALTVLVSEDGVIPTLFIDSDETVTKVAHDYPDNVVVEVAATGTGCLLIHRDVLTTMQDAANGSEWCWFNEGERIGGDGVGRWIGEDINFCLMARQHGFKVYVDTNVHVGHQKGSRIWMPEDCRKGFSAISNLQPAVLDAGDGEFYPNVVVVPVKDKLELTTSLFHQLCDEATEIVIVDNGSTDGTIEWAEQRDDLTLFHMPGAGIHAMWNAGVDHALKKYGAGCNIAILNNDLDCGPNMLANLSETLRSDLHLAAVCPNYDGREIDGPLQEVDEICAGRYDGTGGLAGFAMMVKGEWFATGWRFPETCRWWYGDNWLLADIMRAGMKAGIAANATVVHLDGGGKTGNWADPELAAILEADRQAFMAHVGAA